ncbi:extracellular calcium-sensing receptor-like [Latimeria chalumnae]|uniref:extracellular calcium-sensing receptor-like n=1 Tax=Latimeria chalumnae TaxID=7897 RepID=UPI0006D910FB|nr:PREDICTED: extracellular calcium-sensing receptor-like [Latimeria chalumnae]|eukprot:XP_014346600.1 PREDICTED: extracellular calcium-sensing receptor-like [Latimeria chalumnae]
MIFTIDEINQNPNLLPNITLGFMIYDTCYLVTRALQGSFWIMTGQDEPIPNYRCNSHSQLAGIIGEARSRITIPMARLLGIYGYPQISYFATVPLLSDRRQFPSFFRTIPSDNFQSYGLVHLLLYFGWTWVGLLAGEDEYGLQGSQIVKEEMEKAGVCLAFSETIPLHYSKEKTQHIADVIKKSSAKAIIVFSTDSKWSPILTELVRQNVTGKVWIATESWSTSSLIFTKQNFKILRGTIGFAVRSGKIPGLKEFLISIYPAKSPDDIFIREFWEEAFGCKWSNPDSNETKPSTTTGKEPSFCTGTERLEDLSFEYSDVSSLQGSYNVYNAVYAIAHALHNLYSCKPGEGPFSGETCANILDFKPQQLLHYMKNVHFKNNAGEEIYFDANGDPPAVYDIINWHLTPDGTMKYIKVGSTDFSSPKGKCIKIDQSIIEWNEGHTKIPLSVCSESCLLGYRKAAREGEPICCFDCIRCSEGEITNHIDSAECLRCPDDHWSNEAKDQCILKSIEFLSYEDPMGATLTSVSISVALITATTLYIFIKYRDTPIVKANSRELSYLLLLALMLCFLCSLIFIGYPMRVTCMLRQAAFGIVFTLSVSCVLAKTFMVIIAFNATNPNSNLRKWIGPKLPITIVCVGTLLQVIICIAWLSSSPPFPEQDMKSQVGKIIIECNEGSVLAFWCMLGYMGLLAIISFIVAFLARKLPGSFNEAQFITFSMLVFVTVWLAFIPAYLSTRGKYMAAVEIFAILASSAGLLACIFFPKCYIIILKPHMNTKEYMMGKESSSNKKTEMNSIKL